MQIKKIKTRRNYTTGQVGKACGVSPKIVSRWIDSGELKGFKVPMSPDRRVPHESLIEFMKKSGIPLMALEGGEERVVTVGLDDSLVETLRMTFGDRIKSAVNGFSAGRVFDQTAVRLVIIDFEIGAGEAISTAEAIKAAFPRMHVFAVVPEDDTGGLYRGLFTHSFKHPFNSRTLLEAVHELTGPAVGLEGVER